MATAGHSDFPAAAAKREREARAGASIEENSLRQMVREIFATSPALETEDDLRAWLSRPAPANRYGVRD